MAGFRQLSMVWPLAVLALGSACVGSMDGVPEGAGPDASPGADAGPGQPDAAPEPDFNSVPWVDVGYGVAMRDSHNPRGNNVFIGYAGYQVNAGQARVWMSALYDSALRDLGVRYVYAVQGPNTVTYSNFEIGNTKLIADVLPRLDGDAFIAVAAHSSGAWVSCEIFSQLYQQGYDPQGATSGRIVYYDLDGVAGCLSADIVNQFRGIYFVAAGTNANGGGLSLNASSMMSGASTYGAQRYLQYDASASGCNGASTYCLHVSLINTHPHDSNNGTPYDYEDFSIGPVNRWYLDATAADLTWTASSPRSRTE